MCNMCMQCLSGQEKPDFLGLEFQLIVSHHEGSGSQTQVWKKSVLLATELSSLRPLNYKILSSFFSTKEQWMRWVFSH